LVVRGAEYEPLRSLLWDEPAADGDSLAVRAVRAGRVVWLANVESDPAFQQGRRQALPGIRGACAIPVKRGQDVVAVLEFLSPSQLVPAEAATSLLDNVALMLGAATGPPDGPPGPAAG
ncbi:MAG: GAF domain-containing protein, partial [Acidobacteria bacterium]|nr:GAF domain-containing protein [Acidobacteriota bacterium]